MTNEHSITDAQSPESVDAAHDAKKYNARPRASFALDEALARVLSVAPRHLGDCGAELELIHRYCVSKARKCHAFGGKDQAEDLSSEVLVELLKARPPVYDPERSAKPLLKFLLRTRLYRKTKRDVRESSEAESVALHANLIRVMEAEPLDAMVRDELQQVIELALFQMPAKQRSVLDLYASSMPSLKIAELLGVSTGALHLHFMRARDAFAKSFREIWQECGFALDMLPSRMRASRSRARSGQASTRRRRSIRSAARRAGSTAASAVC